MKVTNLITNAGYKRLTTNIGTFYYDCANNLWFGEDGKRIGSGHTFFTNLCDACTEWEQAEEDKKTFRELNTRFYERVIFGQKVEILKGDRISIGCLTIPTYMFKSYYHLCLAAKHAKSGVTLRLPDDYDNIWYESKTNSFMMNGLFYKADLVLERAEKLCELLGEE